MKFITKRDCGCLEVGAHIVNDNEIVCARCGIPWIIDIPAIESVIGELIIRISRLENGEI